MYGTTNPTGSTDEEKYKQTHANINNSTIKGNGSEENDTTTVDGWYKANIVANNLEAFVADNLFCNDRSFASSNTGTGYGLNATRYRGYSINFNKTSFKCKLHNDALTISDTTHGNAILTYPVALITIDEAASIGGYNIESNYFLKTGTWYWTMTAGYFNGTKATELRIAGNGVVTSTSFTDSVDFGVRPVLSLVPEIEFKSGDGTKDSPFVVNTDTTPNKPDIKEGMIPIKYNDTTMVSVSPDSTDYYNYNNHEWANAVLVNYEDSTIRNKYFNNDNTVKTDVEVDINDVLQMYVWIPRYRYKLWNAENGVSEPQAINIQFISENITNPVGKQESEYKNGEWLVHPAFTFGETELSGIWVGKFEMSGTTSVPTILPNKQSLTGINVSTMFNSLQGMTNVKYGINTSSTDTHMMKNIEWGAASYLSHSIYGRYNSDGNCIASGCKVWINNVNTGYGNQSSTYDDQPQYGPSITGCAGNKVNDELNSNKTSCEENYDWLTNGVNASTTGNKTGIYDMSGGDFEYVMGVMYDSDGTTPRYLSSGFNASTMPASKYYDTYSYEANGYGFGDSSEEAKSSIARYHLGEGNRETLSALTANSTRGWYGGLDFLIFTNTPWVVRGGSFVNVGQAGLFAFGRNPGVDTTPYFSFRATLTSK